MKKLLIISALFSSVIASRECVAQPLPNTLAPDWTYNDINGISHHLYDDLDSGYMVIIDISATWCPPCWAFHNTHVADSLTKHYGPNGTIIPKKIKFYLFEGDRFTGNADLYGNTATSEGNWVAGTNYPIIDTSGLNVPYNSTGYPTFVAICSNKRVVYGSFGGNSSETFWVNLMNNCPIPSSVKDAALLSTEETVNLCANTVLMQNMGNQPITSATVKMFNGSNLVSSQLWSGNLQSFGVVPITFPPGNPANGAGTLKFKLDINGDVNPSNDTLISAYDIASLSGNKIRIEIKTDRISYEDMWVLMDGANLIDRKEYGLYDTNQVFIYNYTVNNGACLRFMLNDEQENGLNGATTFTTNDDGYVKIYDGANNNLLISYAGNGFTKQIVKHYRAAGVPSAVQEELQDESLKIFPNPANDEMTITYSNVNTEGGWITITDLTGRKLVTSLITKDKGQRLRFSVRNWAEGIYLVTLQTTNAKITGKLRVVH